MLKFKLHFLTETKWEDFIELLHWITASWPPIMIHCFMYSTASESHYTVYPSYCSTVKHTGRDDTTASVQWLNNPTKQYVSQESLYTGSLTKMCILLPTHVFNNSSFSFPPSLHPYSHPFTISHSNTVHCLLYRNSFHPFNFPSSVSLLPTSLSHSSKIRT